MNRQKAAPSVLLLSALAVFSGLASPAATLHVWLDSPSPVAPYTNWATAAHGIQEAVDAATAGDEIMVQSGVYATGGRAVHGTMTNRVAVDRPLVVRSLNGPEVTVIQGRQLEGTTTGDGAIRCAYLTNGAMLSGFTLKNGATRRVKDVTQDSGGGVWGDGGKAMVVNCFLTENTAWYQGGGAYGVTLIHCTLLNNSASYKGGGASMAALNHCTLKGNSATEGGGATLAALNNCVLIGNSAMSGGGACCGTLNNCTVAGNLASSGGGAWNATLNNCIVYYNKLKDTSSRIATPNHLSCTLAFCCTAPLPTNAVGCITNEPRFVDLLTGNLRLQPVSPCIDAGTNSSASGATDLDGRPRTNGKKVDMGAYEF